MIGKLERRILMIYDNKKSLELIRDINYIFKSEFVICEDIPLAKNRESLERLCVKFRCSLFFSIQKGKKDGLHLSMGRLYNNEVIDYVRFEILEFKSIKSLNKSPICIYNYFTIIKGVKPRLFNLFVEFFPKKVSEVCLDNPIYVLEVSFDDVFYVKYCCFENNNLEIIGPYLEMKSADAYFCSKDEFKSACGIEESNKKKNIKKNANMDVVGRLYVPKQNLDEINLKKSRGYKNS